MFKSYSSKFKEFKNDKHYYDVTIIDDDFEETIAVTTASDSATASAAYAVSPPAAIINIYSKRNLNVAKNLYLLMKYNKDYLEIQNQIEYYKIYVPDFEKYLPEINKYLTLE